MAETCGVCGRPNGWDDRRDTCPVWMASFDRWATRWENLAVHYRLGYERLLREQPSALRAQYVAGRLEGLEMAARLFDADVTDGEAHIACCDVERDLREIVRSRALVRDARETAARIRELAEQAKREGT